jgi:hypothetical protein
MKYATHYVKLGEATKVLSDLGFSLRYVDQWRYKYQNLRVSAYKRGSILYLSFRQYMKLARKAGIQKPSQIGKTPDKYQMSRKGDIGDYVWGNCRFLTMKENLEEKRENGGLERAANKIRGRNKFTDAGYAKVSKAKLGRTKENDLGRLVTSIKLTCRKRPDSDFRNVVKSFVVRSPSGKEYRGKYIGRFCSKHGLQQSGMSRTLNGIQSSHKGWTGKYIKVRHDD